MVLSLWASLQWHKKKPDVVSRVSQKLLLSIVDYSSPISTHQLPPVLLVITSANRRSRFAWTFRWLWLWWEC